MQYSHDTQQTNLPLVFFAIAFSVVLLGLFSKFSFQKETLTNTAVKRGVVIPTQKDMKARLKNLDYNSPISCTFANADASVSAQLDGNSVIVVIRQKTEVTKAIVEGDCVYSWIEAETEGKKQCGVSQYISIGKQLLGSGLVPVGSLNTFIKQVGINLPIDIDTLFESCENVSEVKKEVFVIPRQVRFE